jgi:hypothetical protein
MFISLIPILLQYPAVLKQARINTNEEKQKVSTTNDLVIFLFQKFVFLRRTSVERSTNSYFPLAPVKEERKGF